MVWYALILMLVLLVARKPLTNYVINNWGPEYLPDGKKYLLVGLVVGSLAGITGSVFDLIGKEAKTDSDEVVAVALGVALMLIFLLMIVNLFRRHKGKGFWFRYWSNSFFFVMAFFVGVLVGTFFIWGGVLIMLAVLIYYGVGCMTWAACSGAPGAVPTAVLRFPSTVPGAARPAPAWTRRASVRGRSGKTVIPCWRRVTNICPEPDPS